MMNSDINKKFLCWQENLLRAPDIETFLSHLQPLAEIQLSQTSKETILNGLKEGVKPLLSHPVVTNPSTKRSLIIASQPLQVLPASIFASICRMVGDVLSLFSLGTTCKELHRILSNPSNKCFVDPDINFGSVDTETLTEFEVTFIAPTRFSFSVPSDFMKEVIRLLKAESRFTSNERKVMKSTKIPSFMNMFGSIGTVSCSSHHWFSFPEACSLIRRGHELDLYLLHTIPSYQTLIRCFSSEKHVIEFEARSLKCKPGFLHVLSPLWFPHLKSMTLCAEQPFSLNNYPFDIWGTHLVKCVRVVSDPGVSMFEEAAMHLNENLNRFLNLELLELDIGIKTKKAIVLPPVTNLITASKSIRASDLRHCKLTVEKLKVQLPGVPTQSFGDEHEFGHEDPNEWNDDEEYSRFFFSGPVAAARFLNEFVAYKSFEKLREMEWAVACDSIESLSAFVKAVKKVLSKNEEMLVGGSECCQSVVFQVEAMEYDQDDEEECLELKVEIETILRGFTMYEKAKVVVRDVL